MVITAIRRCACILCLLLLFPALSSAASTVQKDPFCAGTGCRQTRQYLKQLCNYIVKKKSHFPVIFVGGYYMRTLVAGYDIFGDQRYLNTAIAYADYLLKKQMPNGFWASGYGTVYLADTGSALGLFITLYHHVDHQRQKEYFDAVQRYINSIEKDGMIQKDGALGTGWLHVKNGVMTHPIRDQYTISSALTGAEIFTWMYHVTGQNKYREVAYRALKWILSTMRSDGNIPYILAEEGANWSKRGNPKVDYDLWHKWTYDTSAYVGEGALSFDLYCGNPAWRRWIESAIRPNIEFLLRTQNANGTWAKPGSSDQARSPGVINLLTWYYEHIHHDPRVERAVRRFDAFILNPRESKAWGLLGSGAATKKWNGVTVDVARSLTGRALADIVEPGVDARW